MFLMRNSIIFALHQILLQWSNQGEWDWWACGTTG